MLSTSFDKELEERFVRYAKIDTEADSASKTTPSTQKQYDLLNLLVEELKEIGAQDVTLTNYGTVLASLPATMQRDVPTIAFLAHVDTAPQFTGKNVKPITHRKYNGEDIILPDDPSQVLVYRIPDTGPSLTGSVLVGHGGPDGGGGVAANPITHHVFVTNAAEDTVSVFDGGSLLLLDTVPTGDDPMGRIVELVAEYWAREDQNIVISCLKGIFSAATMAGNKLAIASETIAGQSSSTRLNGSTFSWRYANTRVRLAWISASSRAAAMAGSPSRAAA